MDPQIAAAARALAAGDALGALNQVALRDDAPALALRGIALAQVGDLVRAKALVRRAARAFGSKQPVARARCVVAEAEIALASRDLTWPVKALDAARATLESHGDRVNAAHARYLDLRRLVLIGRLTEAERLLVHVDPAHLPPASKAVHELIVAGIAVRRLRTKTVRAALARAERAARESRIPALKAEVETAAQVLVTPAARLSGGTRRSREGGNPVTLILGDRPLRPDQGEAPANRRSRESGKPAASVARQRLLRLDEVETLLASKAFVVDACRYIVRDARTQVSLARRPVLFTLARALAEAWPGDVSRDALVARAFRAKRADESHRARLRVEIGRLRRVLHGLATVTATERGFALGPRHAREVNVLLPPTDEPHAAVLAFLYDGESWSSSALAVALGASQRSVQRSLDALAEAGKVQSIGRGRARRWMTPPAPGFTTALLLPPAFAID